MKVNEDAISSVGLSLLYEPDEPVDSVVDIILVHGLGGHPVRSWKSGTQSPTRLATPSTSTAQPTSSRRRLKKQPPVTPLRRSNSEPLLVKEDQLARKARSLGRKNSLKSTSRLKLAELIPAETEAQDEVAQVPEVYWPLEMLPTSCPKARIFTWGYHTLVVDKKPLRLQNDSFAHAKDLVIEVATARTTNGALARPIIFITHSTGGLLVKEALRIAEAERDGPLKEILQSTAGVVFMACPHRMSERSSLGDAIKSMASVTLQVDPNDQVLQELSGAKNIQSEIGRQAFLRIWNDYNFKVKTFQESVVLSYRLLEVRVEATARRLASFLGDPREAAETISATHGDVCRFSSSNDSGYRSLGLFLGAVIRSEEDRKHILTAKETECLAALVRPHHTFSETHPATSYPGTCLWLYDSTDFQSWHHRSEKNKHKILWIRGESGCGKTILLRSLRRRLERQWAAAGASFIWTSAEGHNTDTIFFPGTRRQQHEINPANAYRSLLAQLFPQDPSLRQSLLKLYHRPRDKTEMFDDQLVVSFFADHYIDQKIETPTRRTFIFVDVSDDAGPAYVQELVCRLSQLARNSDFTICIASAHHAELEESGTLSIVMHLRNSDDILRYINLNLIAEWEERNQTVMTIGQKAGGVFLWAEIVVNILNAAIAEGASEEMIEYTLDEVPGHLHGLYEWMLATLNEREKAESLMLFQWVILAAEPMRLNDLFVAIRLTEPAPFAAYEHLGHLMALSVGPPSSMRELRQLRNSEITSDTPYQFHRWLRARSIGLLELKTDSRQGVANESWGLQKVQPIHSSVRSFFHSGKGFACLADAGLAGLAPQGLSPEVSIDLSHYSLVRACLTYLNMRDFENLGHTRFHDKRPISPQHHHPSPSISQVTSPATTSISNLSTLVNSPALSPQEMYFREKTFVSQRNLIMSSYPFLQYAVDNLLFHLLSPRFFRYFLPQHELFVCLSANRFRLWRRWTSLVGTADPVQILHKHTAGTASETPNAAAALLSPVFGARFRLERVFRKLNRLSSGPIGIFPSAGPKSPVKGSGGLGLSDSRVASSRMPRTPRTPKTPPNSALPTSAIPDTGAGPETVITGFFDQHLNASTPTSATAAAAAGLWAPTITSHFQMPPTISLPVPPKTRRGLLTGVVPSPGDTAALAANTRYSRTSTDTGTGNVESSTRIQGRSGGGHVKVELSKMV
ncbi:hypothetical protein QBC37DRAFT_355718 [Rhypophila decipiens]|uniref:Nephrocystin 3-like N-terminal domain-containing protein n=1 Tax=Rhypophila decipiens TaxID=261697 RepID=A0AAN6XUM3_9PEZI|nr:hypothetical protein QBC37DRAFT_355718 [Rhypophila decipiens]